MEKNEIKDTPTSKYQARIPLSPKYIFFFGAGASYGSDGGHLVKTGKLPPLGKDLFTSLYTDVALDAWRQLPAEAVSLFEKLSFEEAMDELAGNQEWQKKSFARDMELSIFFSKFRPLSSNLYWKLAEAVSRRMKRRNWSGAAITLNYERLLEESFMKNGLFTVVKGITFYDDSLPQLEDNQLFEICYPHGGCQFFLGQNWLKGFKAEDIQFGETARALQTEGVNHILKQENIKKACELLQFPMICRYQSSKRPSVKNYFIDTQQGRCAEMILNAEFITIIGVLCSHAVDRHLWSSLEQTSAFITYVEPGSQTQEAFRAWAQANNKIEEKNYRVVPATFKDALNTIKEINGLTN